MPALNGMAPSSLEQLMKSLINAPKSVFKSIDQSLLEQVRNNSRILYEQKTFDAHVR